MIHKFTALGEKIVLDVASGAVHLLDDVSYLILDFMSKNGFDRRAALYEAKKQGFTQQQVDEAYGELLALQEEGMLFSDDEYAALAQIPKQSVIKALCLHICHDCNLRCEYCFAGTGDFKGARSMMSAETGKKAIDFVIKNSQNRKNIEIDYFGGEPLMNFEVVKEITEYAKAQGEKHGKNFRFTITTNGLLLNEDIKAYINENMSNVVLSIDGRKKVNDKMRHRIDGSGSYDSILPKFLDLAESRNQDKYYVRGTFTKFNTDFSADVLHLADLGFKQISVEPVVTDEAEPYALSKADLPEIFAQYEALAGALVKRENTPDWFNFFHFMVDLDQGPCVYKRLSGCGAGHEYVAVTPAGDIFPCHQFADKPEFKMGNVYEEGYDKKISERFAGSNVYTKEACRTCWAKFYCSGGCAAGALNQNGDINKPYELACEMEKKRTECAIAIRAKEMQMAQSEEL